MFVHGRFGGLRQLVGGLFMVSIAMLLVGCGSGAESEPAAETETEPSEVDTATADESAEAALRDELASLQEAMEVEETVAAAQKDRVDELTAELDSVRDELVAEQERTTDLTSDLDRASLDLAEEKSRADDAEAEVAALLGKYDQEIRADAQVAWDDAAATACEEAGDGASAIGQYIDYTDQLALIGTEDELVELVTACAEPLRNRSEQERLSSECERGSVDAVTKDPDGLAGQCYVMYVIPWQWDSRTGACNFLGSWDGVNLGTRSFNYDGDGLFRAPAEVCEEDLTDADQDDLLQIWGTLDGAYRYDTAAGGTNEIPDFQIRQAVLISKG